MFKDTSGKCTCTIPIWGGEKPSYAEQICRPSEISLYITRAIINARPSLTADHHPSPTLQRVPVNDARMRPIAQPGSVSIPHSRSLLEPGKQRIETRFRSAGNPSSRAGSMPSRCNRNKIHPGMPWNKISTISTPKSPKASAMCGITREALAGLDPDP